MKIKNIKVSEIKPNPKNPRIITSQMLEKLKTSLSEYPDMLEVRPLILNSDNIILAGNMRYKAAVELGFETLPCVYAEDLTEEEQENFLIKNNLSYGEWNWDDIITKWQINSVKDWGLDVPGFFFDDDVEPEIEIKDEFNRIKSIIIKFPTQEYTQILDELNAVNRREDLFNYSEAILFLIDFYENN